MSNASSVAVVAEPVLQLVELGERSALGALRLRQQITDQPAARVGDEVESCADRQGVQQIERVPGRAEAQRAVLEGEDALAVGCREAIPGLLAPTLLGGRGRQPQITEGAIGLGEGAMHEEQDRRSAAELGLGGSNPTEIRVAPPAPQAGLGHDTRVELLRQQWRGGFAGATRCGWTRVDRASSSRKARSRRTA